MTKSWQTIDRFLELRSSWLTLIGEHLESPEGQRLEYWRVERADSVIVLPIHNQQLILPPSVYRPGLGEATLDFPGGRMPSTETPNTIAPKILRRELGMVSGDIDRLYAVNSAGWPVNSSFSNQRLYGMVAELRSTVLFSSKSSFTAYPTTKTGIQSLLKVLMCLQCRAVLLEWWMVQLFQL